MQKFEIYKLSFLISTVHAELPYSVSFIFFSSMLVSSLFYRRLWILLCTPMWHYDQHESLRTNRKRSKPPKKGQPEGALYDYGDNINLAVFSSLQGEPHNHQIAALAVALKQAMSPVFKAYIQQVKANTVALGNHLMGKGYKLVTDGDGTENHLVLRDFHPLGLTGMHNMKVIPSPR